MGGYSDNCKKCGKWFLDRYALHQHTKACTKSMSDYPEGHFAPDSKPVCDARADTGACEHQPGDCQLVSIKNVGKGLLTIRVDGAPDIQVKPGEVSPPLLSGNNRLRLADVDAKIRPTLVPPLTRDELLAPYIAFDAIRDRVNDRTQRVPNLYSPGTPTEEAIRKIEAEEVDSVKQENELQEELTRRMRHKMHYGHTITSAIALAQDEMLRECWRDRQAAQQAFVLKCSELVAAERPWLAINAAPRNGTRVELWIDQWFGGVRGRPLYGKFWHTRWEDDEGQPIYDVTHFRMPPTGPK